jgi:hypothetical protein
MYMGVVAGCHEEPEPIWPIEMELRALVLARSTMFICSPAISIKSPPARPVPELLPPLISMPGMSACVSACGASPLVPPVMLSMLCPSWPCGAGEDEGDGVGDGAGLGPCISWLGGCGAASLSGCGAAAGGSAAGEGVGEGVGAVISMPGISSRSAPFSGCEVVGCGSAARGRFAALLGCAALFFGAFGFGFGLLAAGMLLMSCPSCWASASGAQSPALKAKQSAVRTSQLILARKLRLNMIPLKK